MNIYLEMFLVGMIGIVFQVGFKARSLMEKTSVSNMVFSWKEYFKKDLLSLILSLAAIGLLEFFIRDTMEYFQDNRLVLPLMKLTFTTTGYAGAEIMSRLFGKYSQMINKVIDIKTNIADGKGEQIQ